jgi:hypothetical protein
MFLRFALERLPAVSRDFVQGRQRLPDDAESNFRQFFVVVGGVPHTTPPRRVFQETVIAAGVSQSSGDIEASRPDVRFVPKADIAGQDHHVR